MTGSEAPRRTNQDYFEALLAQLRAEGHRGWAVRLDEVLHHVAWTTGSELLGAVGLLLRELQQARPPLSRPLRQLLRACRRRTGVR